MFNVKTSLGKTSCGHFAHRDLSLFSLFRSHVNSLLSASSPLGSHMYKHHHVVAVEPQNDNQPPSTSTFPQTPYGERWENTASQWRKKNKSPQSFEGFVSREAPPSRPHQAPPPPHSSSSSSSGGWGWLIRGLPRERNGSLAKWRNDRVREEGGVRL